METSFSVLKTICVCKHLPSLWMLQSQYIAGACMNKRLFSFKSRRGDTFYRDRVNDTTFGRRQSRVAQARAMTRLFESRLALIHRWKCFSKLTLRWRLRKVEAKTKGKNLLENLYWLVITIESNSPTNPLGLLRTEKSAPHCSRSENLIMYFFNDWHYITVYTLYICNLYL